MAQHLFVRPVRPSDREMFVKWSLETKDNLCDLGVLNYKSTSVLCAYDDEGPLAFLPVQLPYMLEALAVRPGADPAEVAIALKELVQALVTQMHMSGTGEMYFVTKNDSTARFAEKQASFEKLPWSVYRLKLSDLEKPKE